eukprot:5478081-Prorocentrum_lima.AAC.1
MALAITRCSITATSCMCLIASLFSSTSSPLCRRKVPVRSAKGPSVSQRYTTFRKHCSRLPR